MTTSPTPTEAPAPGPAPAGRLAYQPALDGLRAVAVTMVVLFHAGFDFMPAGYLGVSIFFTLSGYLITSLLLSELVTTGAVDLGRFVARRARRLLPASLLCLGLIAAARSVGEFSAAPDLRRELIGAAANVFNWVRIGGDSSYTDLFAASPTFVSPVEHYWSLAIEEQFYLLWPVVLVFGGRRLLRRGGGRSATAPLIGFVATAFAVAVVAAPLLAAWFGPDVAYWSTPTRAAELLAGALLAALVLHRPVPPWVGRVAAPAALALVVLAVVLPTSTGPAYTGWMAPIAVTSALLLAGLQRPSATRRLLSQASLVALGRVSYGVYLFHWPVFVLLRQHGWEITAPGGFALAAGLTGVLAMASYVMVERPIREARWPVRVTIPGAAIATVVAVIALAVMPMSRGFLEPNRQVLDAAAATPVDSLVDLRPATPAPGPLRTPATVDPATTDTATNNSATTETAVVDLATGDPVTAQRPTNADPNVADAPGGGSSSVGSGIVGGDQSALSGGSWTLPAAAVAISPAPDLAFQTDVVLAPPPSRPVRLLTVGDSTAFYVGQALAEWAVDRPGYATSDLLWCVTCGFVLEGTITSWDSDEFVRRNREVLLDELPATLGRVRPDVALLMTTVGDLTDRVWDDADGPLTPLDPTVADRLEQVYREFTVSLLEREVANVAWVIPPTPAPYALGGHRVFEPERWDVMAKVIRRVAADLGPQVVVVDMARWGEATGDLDDEAWRPDGTHFTEATALELVERWLGPTLIATALGSS